MFQRWQLAFHRVDIVSLFLRETAVAATSRAMDHPHCLLISCSLFSMLTYQSMSVTLQSFDSCLIMFDID